MNTFNLRIITADGIKFEGEAEAVMVRGVSGDIGIRANHIDYVTALGTGKTVVTANGEKRYAASSKGVLTVIKNEVTVLASAFEWQDEIDVERAKAAEESAKKRIAAKESDRDVEAAKRKLRRAQVRIEVANGPVKK